jgi:hypothetical protein
LKDFFKENWKIAAACACGAFLLSLLIGLIAQNPFGVMLLRAFLLALLFAGLGVGARLVVKTYLPDLLATGAASAAAIQGEAGQGAGKNPRGTAAVNPRGTAAVNPRGTATRVDIVLPQDDGLEQQLYTANGRSGKPSSEIAAAEAGPEAGAALAEESESAGYRGSESAGYRDEDASARAEEQAIGELDEELAEELTSTAEDRQAEEFAETAEAEETEAGEIPPPDRDTEGTLDSLPDISNLEVAPDPGSAEPSPRRAKRSPAAESPSEAMRGSLSGQDPATLARAIRTVLKNEEKG